MSNIVVTGMGVVSTAGFELDAFWDTLVRGTITYSEIEELQDDANFRIKIGAKIKKNSWEDNIPDCMKSYGKAAKYAVSAAKKAFDEANLPPEASDNNRIAVIIGTTMGEIQTEEEITRIKCESRLETVPKELFKQYRTDNIGIAVQRALKVSGPVYLVPAACAAGNYAIALGKRLIEWNYADVAIVGGVDVFSRVAFTGFQRLLSLAPDFCKPFDQERKGLVVGEGCGILVMEREGFRKRQYPCYGQILGVGITSDRYHMTASHPDGDGSVRAMKQALDEAGILPDDIGYISAHGTGTAINDCVEVKALQKVYGDKPIPPISSIKSMLGHAMGAASAFNLIASFLMMKHNMILPTMNYSILDPACVVDCVPNQARKGNPKYILSNSFAFGGQVSSVIIGGRK